LKKATLRKSLDTLSAIKDSPGHEALSKMDGSQYRSFLGGTSQVLGAPPRKSLLAEAVKGGIRDRSNKSKMIAVTSQIPEMQGHIEQYKVNTASPFVKAGTMRAGQSGHRQAEEDQHAAFDDVDEYPQSAMDDPDQSIDMSKRYVTPNVGMGARASKAV
jgi:hypothetical protein